MERVFLSGEGWRSGPVWRARGFFQKWRGLRRCPQHSSLLLRTRSVHGFGMGRPFLAVGLTGDLKVVASKTVPPRRIAYFPGCRWVLELPVDASPPPTGVTLEAGGA